MARIGIYGGTFNPVHNGHIYLARAAMEQLSLSEVWWIISGNPPHKEDGILSRFHRYEMCQRSLSGMDGMVVKDFELYRSGQCYTFELMEMIHKKYPDNDYFFIMGEDSLEQFSDWVHPERIANKAALAVAVRSEDKEKNISLENAAMRVEKEYKTGVFLLKTKDIPISSSNLRLLCAKGKSIKAFVPEAASAYIKSHGLYANKTDTGAELIKIAQKLKLCLKPGRYRHTIGVMETAANLAMRYLLPVDKLRMAGLLHDCAKCYDNKELLLRCKKYGLPVTKAEKRSPHLLHAKVGAYLARHEYKCKDPDVLRAISVHTTGAPDMDMVSQILFVADYIEPNRNRASRLEEIRQMAYRDIDLCTVMILEDTISFLKEKGNPMDEATVDTWKFYEEKERKKYGAGQNK